MKPADLRDKVIGYPVPVASAIVAIIAGFILWYDGDDGAVLAAQRDSMKESASIVDRNKRNARNIQVDISRAKSLHEKIVEKALDFDSSIDSTAFVSHMAENRTVRISGLPVPRGVPTEFVTKPYARNEYSLSAEGDFGSMLGFLGEISGDDMRSMVVIRAQLMATDTTPKTGIVKADIGFRVWGIVKTHPAKIASAPADKSVLPAEERKLRLQTVEALLNPGRSDMSGAINPFGDSLGFQSAGEAPGTAELETIVRNFRFSIGTIDGNPVVKIEGQNSLPKRINSEIEVMAGGKLNRVRITAIDDDSFTVVTTTGKKIQVSPHK